MDFSLLTPIKKKTKADHLTLVKEQLEFIRKYIPELKDIPDRDVFNWHKTYIKYDTTYKPIVNYQDRKEEWYILTKK
jgi:deoxyribodipyrimidine photolyase